MTVPRIMLACLVSSLVGSLSASAEYYADTPMPDRPGCEIIDRVPIFNGYRHGMRIYWRCPRFSEPEEECCESAETEEPQASDADTPGCDRATEPEPEYTYSPVAPAAAPPQWQPPVSSYPNSPDIPATAGFLAVLAVIALLVIGLVANSGNASSLDRDVRETRALTEKLNAAASEADARIAAFLKKEGLDA